MSVDPRVEGGVQIALLNVTPSQCLLAMAFDGNFTVITAENTTAAEGGKLAFDAKDINVYYPTETPAGDISKQLGTVCPKE